MNEVGFKPSAPGVELDFQSGLCVVRWASELICSHLGADGSCVSSLPPLLGLAGSSRLQTWWGREGVAAGSFIPLHRCRPSICITHRNILAAFSLYKYKCTVKLWLEFDVVFNNLFTTSGENIVLQWLFSIAHSTWASRCLIIQWKRIFPLHSNS